MGYSLSNAVWLFYRIRLIGGAWLASWERCPGDPELPTLPSGTTYRVMRHLCGANLGDWVGKEPTPFEDVVRVTEQIPSASELAHRHGMIHRDIQPTNILLDEEHGDMFVASASLRTRTRAESDRIAV